MQSFKTFKNLKDLLIVIALIILAGIVFWHIGNYFYHLLPQQVLIITKEPVYESKSTLSLAIKNVMPNNICFSSCYPYYLEVKTDKWKTYEYYESCPNPDLIESCIEPDYARFFSIDLPDLSPGLHRIRVPVTIAGRAGEEFQMDQIYYSNEFIIR
jgi:hypothetical protein